MGIVSFDWIKSSHGFAVWVAIITGFFIILGMLLGNHPMPGLFGVNQTIRQICVALWTFLLPAWFTVDDYWAPRDNPTELAKYRENQQAARVFWTVVGGAAAIIIGATAPSIPANSAPNVPGASAPSVQGTNG
jgi:hypothetical protein